MRIILYLILLFLLYIVARALLFPKRVSKQGQTGSVLNGDEMVLDPVCQSYFPKNSALTTRQGGETIYFCSKECREKFLREA